MRVSGARWACAGSAASREAGGAPTAQHALLTEPASRCSVFLKMRPDGQYCCSWGDRGCQGALHLCLAFLLIAVVLVLKAAVDS